MSLKSTPSFSKQLTGSSTPIKSTKTSVTGSKQPSNKNLQNKLKYIEPPSFPENIAKYLQPNEFPEIPDGSTINPAGELINSKYGHLTLIVGIWFVIGRLLCDKPSKEDKPVSGPELVLDGFDPILISYITTEEQWYLQITLAALNNVWCGADWNYDIKLRTECSKTLQSPDSNPADAIPRMDILTDYHINVNIPDFWGYIRFKILDKQQRSFEQTSGCFKYQFKNLKFKATVTTKLIDKRFRTSKHKFRAPDINISYEFDDVKHDILWYPFVGDELPNDDDLNIPNLNPAKIKNIIDDVFIEKIEQNREEFVERYIRSVLTKLIPHVVEECRSKVDLILTFATVLANGTEDDVYYLPPAASKLIKLGVYSVTQKQLRNKILQKFISTSKLPDDIQKKIEQLETDYQAGLKKLTEHTNP